VGPDPEEDAAMSGRRWQAAGTLGVTLALASSALAADASQIERGRYLTHDVAMCVQCHTPRDATGALVESEEFMGGTFPVGPPRFIPEAAWCITTPRVAGLPGFTDAEAIEFFMTGARLGRHQPKWPMPPFRMSRPDAEAVVAYLRSLDRPTEGPRNR
jgi:mono/diheme cytochrome c family protein